MTRHHWNHAVVIACLIVGTTSGVSTLGAQQATPPGGAVVQGSVATPDSAVAARRQQLLQQIRQKFEKVVKQRLQLTDAQMKQLRQTNRRYEGQRKTLNERERAIRQAMRQELRPGVAADENHLSTLTDSLFDVQRARLDLLQQEQRDLSQFMTVVQRVRYYALEDQLRQKLEQVRQRLQQQAAAAAAF